MTRERFPALRALVASAHAVAALLVVFPLFDLLVNVWPLRLGDLRWRYGTAGLLSGLLLTPLLGLLLHALTASLAGQRRTLRLLGWLSATGSVVLLLVVVLFSLDVLQLRATVPANALGVFQIGAVRAVVKLLVAAAWLLLLARGTRRAARALARQVAAEGGGSPGLVVPGVPAAGVPATK